MNKEQMPHLSAAAMGMDAASVAAMHELAEAVIAVILKEKEEMKEELPALPSLGEVLTGQALVVVKEEEEERGEVWTSLVFEKGYTLIIQSPWVLIHPSGRIMESEAQNDDRG